MQGARKKWMTQDKRLLLSCRSSLRISWPRHSKRVASTLAHIPVDQDEHFAPADLNGVAPDRVAIDQESMERLCDWLKTKRRVVILSGAGCSTESGLPDYRSPRYVFIFERDYSIFFLEEVIPRVIRLQNFKTSLGLMLYGNGTIYLINKTYNTIQYKSNGSV